MPKKKQKSPIDERAIVEKLTPNSVNVIINGEEVRVATDASENRLLTLVMASRVRTVFHKALDRYREDEVRFTPKELRDIAGAARDIAALCGETFSAAEPLPTPHQLDPVAGPPINFEILHEIPKVSDPEPQPQASAQ